MSVSDRQAPDASLRVDNRLALLDEAFYEGHRSVGQKEVMQVGWVYGRAVDMDGLKRFHRNLSQGLIGRLIERSPLPVGRHRWVSDPQPPDIDLAPSARPRAEVGTWFDECTQLPIDPEAGPAWRLSVLPLADGGTAVSLLLSHYIIDGIGGALAVTEAVLGVARDLNYPPPRSRTRLRALINDGMDTARDLPAVTRAVVAAAKEARRRQQDGDRPQPSRPVAMPADGTIDSVLAPGVWVQLRLDEWNARAADLGGTGSALATAFTARLDKHMGRLHGDDKEGVTVLLTVNGRTSQEDARAVAVSFARVSIDPASTTSGLGETRSAIRGALATFKESQEDDAKLVPLTPFTPKRLWRQLIDYALTDPDRPAVCSNLGDTGPAAIRPDGTLCDAAFARGASQHLTREWLDRMGDFLQVFYGTIAEINTVSLCVNAYHPRSVTSKAELHELINRTLADFDLTGEVA